MPHSNPCPPLPPQKKTWISLFSLSKGKLHLSDLFMSLWGGGGGREGGGILQKYFSLGWEI